VCVGDTQGGQADGNARRRRARIATAQVRVLPQRHRANVPLSVAGQNHTVPGTYDLIGWLGSRVVSVLDSGAEGPGFKSQPRRCLRQTVHTHRACVHQAAKLVAALLRVAGVTAGLAESNGSLPPGL